MNKKTKQKLINGCMAAAFVLSSTLTPVVANAATLTPSSVIRIGGIDRFETAALMAQKGWTGTSDNVVLSAGMEDNLVDVLGAGPLATKLNAPILLTDGGQSINSFAKAELLRLKPKKVYLTSGTGVIVPSVIEELKGMGMTPVELGGLDRYETSVNIAKELALQGVNISRIVLAAGWASVADALSVSSIAAAQGMPILATTQDQLPAPVKVYLDSIKANVTDSYVVGGAGVVSDAVKGELPGKVSRYSGLDRYATNVQILKNFAKEYKNDKVYVANGESLVDAVAGVPLAAVNHSAVVLVNQPIDNATRDFVKLNMSTDDMVVLGGEGAVSTTGMNALTSVVSYATDSATVGSADATKLELLSDNVRITGDNVTLKNAQADYSVYVKGNNITLSNLTVKGTVFVDPGKTGSATLDGVTAENIVILSGASQSVHITNSTSGHITVSSDGNTNIVLTSVTTNGVSVQTAVVYETDQAGNQVKTGTITITSGAGNALGEMTITSEPGKSADVNLSGEFKQPIKVEGQGATTISAAAGSVVSSVTSNTNALTLAGAGTYTAVVAQSGTLTAATGTTLPSVTVATTNSTQTVTLAGKITNLTQTQGNTTLAAGTTVTNMTTTGSSTIIVPPGASIGSLVSTGTTVPSIGGGGQVGGQTTQIIPTDDIDYSSGGTGGSGGDGGGGIGDPSADPTDQLIAKIMEVHSELTDPEKVALRAAREALRVLPSGDDVWTSPEFNALMTNGESVSDTGVSRTELIQFIKDFSTIYYSEDEVTLEENINTFKSRNSVTFRALFGTGFTMDDFYGFLIETQEVLPDIIVGNLETLELSVDLKENMVAWTKLAMHSIVDDVNSPYHIFATKLSDIGWTVDKLVNAQRRLGTEIDAGNEAEMAIARAAIRSLL